MSIPLKIFSIQTQNIRNVFFVFCVLSLLFLTGCGKFKFWQGEVTEEGTTNILLQNPITENVVVTSAMDNMAYPLIPDTLQGEELSPLIQFELLPYTVEIHCEDSQIVEALRGSSTLLRLQSKIPAGQLALDKRITEDELEAKRIMQGLGYYSGKVETVIDNTLFPLSVTLNLIPGPLYQIGSTDIIYSDINNMDEEEELLTVFDGRPENLFAFGLKEAEPAKAVDILTSVDKIVGYFNNTGFPFAQIDSTKYYALPSSLKLDAEVYVDLGEKIEFGQALLEGSKKVKPSYLERIKPWKTGDIWDQNLLTQLTEQLLTAGIFSYVEGTIGEKKDIEGQRDAIFRVTDGPQRTWGGGINYDTLRGVGGQLFWEHRNLLGEAETLRTETTLWENTQEWTTRFKKPAIYTRYRDLNTELKFKREKTDSYDTTALTFTGGIDQSFEESHYRLSYYVAGEVGSEKDAGMDKSQFYNYMGIPLQLTYRDTNSIFDPSSGMNITLKVAPYAGEYKDRFALVWAEASFSTFIELMAHKKLIAALKLRAGSLYPAKAEDIPASLRFYVGGGGSVRGYAYQSIGPLDNYGNPRGGASFVEGSFELRYKINESIAIVPFIDFGNVYEEFYPTNFELRYSAGLGMRYFTPAGPIRVDVAFPLNAKNKINFNSFQIYVSIGQSF